MTNLDEAITQLQGEIDLVGFPEVGTTLWWNLRAKSHGLSLLRVLQVKGITDPVVAEKFRKETRLDLQDRARTEPKIPKDLP